MASGATAAPDVVEPDWLSARRDQAAVASGELALPTQKDRGWEFTDLAGLDLDGFEQAPVEVAGLEPRHGTDGEPVVLPLAEAAVVLPGVVRKRLGSVVPTDDVFAARNAAKWRDGVLIYVPRGARLTEPVQLTVAGGSEADVEWRALVVLDDEAEAEVWERYESGGEGLFNGVVELVVGQAATLRYVCQQELSERGWVFATQRAEVERDGTLEWVSLGFGSGRGKVRMETKLAGRGSSAKVTGAYAGDGTQHLDYDTTQEHAGEDTVSDLAFRGVLAGEATAVWRGMIRVDRGAQRTDAFQENRNLLLSQTAHADAIPGLEIEADDVRCTHAAAVAQVDPDQLYYLRAHGIDEAAGKRLVVEGFLGELVERTGEGPIRDALARELERRLNELLDGSG